MAMFSWPRSISGTLFGFPWSRPVALQLVKDGGRKSGFPGGGEWWAGELEQSEVLTLRCSKGCENWYGKTSINEKKK